MTILKYMSLGELQTRITDIQAGISRAQARLNQAHPRADYNRRNDLSLCAELNKYLAEINAEINQRQTLEPPPNCS